MRLSELVCEKFIDRKPMIALNPSRGEYQSILNSVTHTDEFPVRALIDIEKGDLYVWNAYDAPHGAVIDRNGINQGMHLMIKGNHVRVLTLWRYERMGYSHDDIEEMVRTNPKLRRIIGDDFEIVIES